MTAWRFTPTPACEHPDCGDLAVLGTAWGGWRCANHRREDTSEEAST